MARRRRPSSWPGPSGGGRTKPSLRLATGADGSRSCSRNCRGRLLLRKLRRAMVAPDREPLAGLVEVDETSIPFRAQGEPVRPGRSHDGKLLVAGAVEIRGKGPGRIRLAAIGDCSAVALGAFVAAGSTFTVEDLHLLPPAGLPAHAPIPS